MAEGDGIAIVGGGPAAHAAAGAYREAGGTEPVRVLAGEVELPYRRPPLTKEFLRGESGRDELPLDGPGWYREREIDLVLGATVTALDLERGEVEDGDGRRGWSFERCLLATGSHPLVPPIPGADGNRVHTVRTVVSSETLRALAGRRVAVIGSGFIGCEAASSLSSLGAAATMATMEEAPQASRLGEEAAARIGGWLEADGVEVLGGAELTEVVDEGGASVGVRFADGRELEADAVVLALGVERNDGLAAAAGIEVSEGVPVDAAMVSSDPRLLAAGDVAWAVNGAAGRRLRAEHWGEALAMGAVAGRTLAGEEAAWDVVPGFWSTIGGRTLKYVGWAEGFEKERFEPAADGGFVVRYGSEGELVGVLAHEDDAAYERGREEIGKKVAWS